MTKKEATTKKATTAQRSVQVLAVILAGIIVTGFVLLIMKKITTTNFWILSGVMGVLAIFALPKLREMTEKQ